MTDLYKVDASILRNFEGDLTRLRPRLVANGLLLVAPEGLGAIASGRTYDDELVHLICPYGLASNDALMLLEARRLGVYDVVSLDAD